MNEWEQSVAERTLHVSVLLVRMKVNGHIQVSQPHLERSTDRTTFRWPHECYDDS